MNIVGIIPARMASSRFPGKPLAKIRGIPMVGHVYFRSKMAKGLDEVYIATCDKEIFDYATSIGAKAIMTADTHRGAADRTAEAIGKIEQLEGTRVDFAAMIQGDEPMLVPEMIDELVAPTKNAKDLQVVNLIQKVRDEAEFESPNTVKLVLDGKNNMLYLSREPIPSRKKWDKDIPRWKQLGMILFSRDALAAYAKIGPTQLEVIESVDVLRFLENGMRIKAVPTTHSTHSVDTLEDLAEVEGLMAHDALVRAYGANGK